MKNHKDIICSKDLFTIKEPEENCLCTLTFPKGNFKSIADEVFMYVEKIAGLELEQIIFPSTLESIGDRCFDGCSNLKKIVLPDNITKLGEECFKSCKHLTDVRLSDNIPILPEYVFAGCVNLQKINIPYNITSISEGSFCLCKNLKQINIPSKLSSIGPSAFEGCEAMEEIELSDEINIINSRTFLDCSSLKKIILPSHLKKIGDKAFLECSNLEYIGFPNTLRIISKQAFEDCSSLKAVVIPDSVSIIGLDAFSNCSNLEAVKIISCGDKKRPIQIRDGAFSGCKNIKALSLPKGALNEKAFDFNDMQNLKYINYADTTILNLSNEETFNNLFFNGDLICIEYTDRTGKQKYKICPENTNQKRFKAKSIQLSVLYTRLLSHDIFKDIYKFSDDKKIICLNMLSTLSFRNSIQLLDKLLDRKINNGFGVNGFNIDGNEDKNFDNKKEADRFGVIQNIFNKIKTTILKIFAKKDKDTLINENTEDFVLLTDYFDILFKDGRVSGNTEKFSKFVSSNIGDIASINKTSELEELSKFQKHFDEIMLRSLWTKISFESGNLSLKTMLRDVSKYDDFDEETKVQDIKENEAFLYNKELAVSSDELDL